MPSHYLIADTSRARGEGEIDGADYHFVGRSQFEEYVSSRRFVEHGEFDRAYYGTSLDAVRTVINSGKICIFCGRRQERKKSPKRFGSKRNRSGSR